MGKALHRHLPLPGWLQIQSSSLNSKVTLLSPPPSHPALPPPHTHQPGPLSGTLPTSLHPSPPLVTIHLSLCLFDPYLSRPIDTKFHKDTKDLIWLAYSCGQCCQVPYINNRFMKHQTFPVLQSPLVVEALPSVRPSVTPSAVCLCLHAMSILYQSLCFPPRPGVVPMATNPALGPETQELGDG